MSELVEEIKRLASWVVDQGRSNALLNVAERVRVLEARAEESEAECAAVKDHLQGAARDLGNLLAIIFRDGGQRQGQLGDKAVAEAREIVGRLILRAEEAGRAEAYAEAMREALGECRCCLLNGQEHALSHGIRVASEALSGTAGPVEGK